MTFTISRKRRGFEFVCEWLVCELFVYIDGFLSFHCYPFASTFCSIYLFLFVRCFTSIFSFTTHTLFFGGYFFVFSYSLYRVAFGRLLVMLWNCRQFRMRARTQQTNCFHWSWLWPFSRINGFRSAIDSIELMHHRKHLMMLRTNFRRCLIGIDFVRLFYRFRSLQNL